MSNSKATTPKDVSSQGSIAALIGIAVDVSGSMTQSIRNRDGTSQSRFNSFHQAVTKVLAEGKGKARELAAQQGDSIAEALVFAYAFGMRSSPGVVDLLTLLRAADGITSEEEIEKLKEKHIAEAKARHSGYGDLANMARAWGFGGLVSNVEQSMRASAESEIRQQIEAEVLERVRTRMKQLGDTSCTVSELAQMWTQESRTFEQAEQFIFGGTPMRQCLEEVASRFERERTDLPTDAETFLVLVSDGASTDGDPTEAIEKIKSQGVLVASCFVTDSDTAELKHLYGKPQDSWSADVRFMFDSASVVTEDQTYREMLEGLGWTVEPDARLFIQANHSQALEEFLSLTFSRSVG